MRDINQKVGPLINFNVLHLKDGLKRMVNKPEPSASVCALRGDAEADPNESRGTREHSPRTTGSTPSRWPWRVGRRP
jgi:hypothetical protein